MTTINRSFPVEKRSIRSAAMKRKEIVEERLFNNIKFEDERKVWEVKNKKDTELTLDQNEIKLLKLFINKPSLMSLLVDYPNALVKDGLFDIGNKVCKYYNISIDQLISRKRDRELIYARRDFCHLAHKKTQCTYVRIGQFLKRDHSLVIHHLRHKPINYDKIDEKSY